MNAIESLPINAGYYGFELSLAFSKTADSGPWPVIHECKLDAPGMNPYSFAS